MTVTFTCVDYLCGSETVTGTATHTSGGNYTLSLTPTVGGTYVVTVTLVNGYTAEFTQATTTVGGICETILVVDERSVPAVSTVTEPTGPFAVGDLVAY